MSFAPILKHGRFPLPAILDQLMTTGEGALGRPVEIEFAIRLPQQSGESAEVGFLQMRPLVLSREGEDVRIEEIAPERVMCRSSQVLGHGRQDLCDVVVVDFHRFERAQSQEVAQSVAHFNARLSASGTPYLLIGVGRWGSNESWLGIPVAWDQIARGARDCGVGLPRFSRDAVAGQPLLPNLTAFQIGYFTVNPDAGEGFVDWDWLSAQAAVEETVVCAICILRNHFLC